MLIQHLLRCCWTLPNAQIKLLTTYKTVATSRRVSRVESETRRHDDRWFIIIRWGMQATCSALQQQVSRCSLHHQTSLLSMDEEDEDDHHQTKLSVEHNDSCSSNNKLYNPRLRERKKGIESWNKNGLAPTAAQGWWWRWWWWCKEDEERRVNSLFLHIFYSSVPVRTYVRSAQQSSCTEKSGRKGNSTFKRNCNRVCCFSSAQLRHRLK